MKSASQIGIVESLDFDENCRCLELEHYFQSRIVEIQMKSASHIVATQILQSHIVVESQMKSASQSQIGIVESLDSDENCMLVLA
jgi:hypothetical protein